MCAILQSKNDCITSVGFRNLGLFNMAPPFICSKGRFVSQGVSIAAGAERGREGPGIRLHGQPELSAAQSRCEIPQVV